MFQKLIELIKQALRSMVGYKSIAQVTENFDTISDDMQRSMDLWRDMYLNKAPWLDEVKGVYSLNLAAMICSSLSRQITLEMGCTVTAPNQEESSNITRAYYLNSIVQNKIVKVMREQLEHGLATGGMIIKPYVSNDTIYLDYSYQGQFVPLAFDDDGNILDIAFKDTTTRNGKKFTKVERHIFDSQAKTVTVINKAYCAKYDPDNADNEIELGLEIPLGIVNAWAQLSPEVLIQNVQKPLYGYFKVASANNIDINCPLGVSAFSKAVNTIKRADIQFSRLDWEYEGGQLAINIDPSALNMVDASSPTSPTLRNRLFRGVDLGADDTFKEFAPTLRDERYREGLNTYLAKIEDQCELSRGTISDTSTEARTATELKILRERSYSTVHDNQKALETCLVDVIDAIDAYLTLYSIIPEGEYETSFDWDDSIITDVNTELAHKIELKQEGLLSEAEVRAWYTGEPLSVAEQKISEIKASNQNKLLTDLFSTSKTNKTLEE